MNSTKPFLATAATFWLSGCAGVMLQFSDYIYSAELASGDHDSAEVRVTHGLDENDMAQVVWIARAAYPVAQEHCGSMGKSAGRYQIRSAGPEFMVFGFRCLAAEDAD